jgi:hypothetical protein
MAVQAVVVPFNGTQDTIAVAWPAPFNSVPTVSVGVGVTDGATLDVQATGVTTTGCTVAPTSAFQGEATLIAAAD